MQITLDPTIIVTTDLRFKQLSNYMLERIRACGNNALEGYYQLFPDKVKCLAIPLLLVGTSIGISAAKSIPSGDFDISVLNLTGNFIYPGIHEASNPHGLADFLSDPNAPVIFNVQQHTSDSTVHASIVSKYLGTIKEYIVGPLHPTLNIPEYLNLNGKLYMSDMTSYECAMNSETSPGFKIWQDSIVYRPVA